MTGFQSCKGWGGAAAASNVKVKLQLPKGEPQAHAPRARRVPNTDSSEAWLPRMCDCEHPAYSTNGTVSQKEGVL